MNAIARRRRAIMAEQEAPAFKIKDIPTASKFKFSSSNTTYYIYLGIINGTAWLLREQLLSTSAKMRNDALCDYEGSLIDNYLTNTLIPSLSARVQERLENTTVTFPASDGTNVANKTITRKGFLLTYAQLNSNDNNVLDTLKKHYGTTSAPTARIAKDSGGTGRSWWTCSAASTSGIRTVGSSGSFGSTVPNTGSGLVYRRPVLSINKETEVELVDGVYVMV